MTFVHLTEHQVAQLVGQGCTASDWRLITISTGCDLVRISNVHFYGTVQIGSTAGSHVVDGVELLCGIYRASVSDCIIGDQARIANIGSVISNYVTEDGVVIQDVASLVADLGATFGNGVELETINEAGGRGIKIINDLTSQTAYVQGMMRHNPEFSKRLAALMDSKAAAAKAERGRVGERARILHCGSLRNVAVGPYAYIHGAQYLENGTINSCAEHSTEVGEGVHAKSFILSEGARIESGAVIDKVFVGQGVKMGKQYSAENSLFFANSEAFHGEAVSVFAGPYTVTHHKSTLLIAGMFSFFNAGSGTNQSNHMYKLGPVHQGVLERGCKTGSFSYLLLEAHIGAFSVVIGKHYANIDTPNLPFSYIKEEGGVTKILPGFNLSSVGTVRDGEKWPKRDNRRSPKKRDLIIFDVFSPYSVEKMRRGRDELLALSENVPNEETLVNYGEALLDCPSMRKGARYYSLAIGRYLNEKVTARLQEALTKTKNWKAATGSLTPKSNLKNPMEWADISGLLTPRERIAQLETAIANGTLSSYDALVVEFQLMYDAYREDEWRYVFDVYEKDYGVRLDAMTKDQAGSAIEGWENAAMAMRGMILEDSKKEFEASTRIGYGVDQSDENVQRDFEAVRGTAETNSVVQKLVAEGTAIQQRKEQFKALLSAIG
jgi:hypothetical protein